MITLILGPMFSSKSTTLLSFERRFRILKRNFVCINHSFDKRYNENGVIATHDKITSQNSHNVQCSSLNELDNDYLNQFDCFLIDESQFFDNINIFAEKWANLGKTIVCAGLNSDFQKQPFDNISKLIPVADKIIHLKSICEKCGEDAPFSKRIVNSDEKTLIGGIESYAPRCRKCF